MARAKVKVRYTYKGLRQYMHTREVLGKLRDTARLGATIAKGIAPRETGFYRRSIKAVRRDKHDRPAYRFGSDDPKAHLLEWGYENVDGSYQEGQRVLGLAAEMLGGERKGEGLHG